MELTYSERVARLQAARPEMKRDLYEYELRAREKPIRSLFQMAMDADVAAKEAADAIPPFSEHDIEAGNRYHEAAEAHYLNTWYAPEIFATGVWMALFEHINTFATTSLGYTDTEVLALRAGERVMDGSGPTFHEVVVTIRANLMHYHEQAHIETMKDLAAQRKGAKRSLSVFLHLGITLPVDSMVGFWILESVTGRSADVLLRLARSVGPDLVALRHPS